MSYKDIVVPELKKRKKELEKAVKKARQIAQRPVDGRLEVVKNGNHYRYYIKCFPKQGHPLLTEQDGQLEQDKQNEQDGQVEQYFASESDVSKRKYLKDINVAKNIANHDYAKQVLKNATQELKQIDSLLKIYEKVTVDECFANLHPGRKALVSSLFIDDEQYAKDWRSATPQRYNSYPINSPIVTENNEIVRSKSEKIIADKLKLYEIPYYYQKPLMLGKTVKFPDFTVLNKYTRKEYYWEHLGMLDDPEYFRDNINKLELYFRNQIIVGKNLIITYETSIQPLSVKTVDKILKEYFLL